jgi:hypothetical protein
MPPDHLLRKTAAMQDRVDEVPGLPNPDGEDTLVVLDYVDRTPVNVVMTEKLTLLQSPPHYHKPIPTS